MTDEPKVRSATRDDLEVIVRIADDRRREYAGYQPVFWRPAQDAHEKHAEFLGTLIDDEELITLVVEMRGAVCGFLIARLVPPPPVYAPGGPSCFIDDFAVDRDEIWLTAGVALLRRAVVAGAQRGAVQVVVVTAHRDSAKRQALADAGLALTSEWWTAAIGRPL